MPGVGEVTRLTRAVAHGDVAAFETLYRQWFPRVLALSMSATGRDESFCLDVTQETMLKAAKSIPVLESEAQLSAWFGKVALRLSLDAMKAERRRGRRERDIPSACEVQDGAAISSDTRAAWLRQVLPTLPLHDYELLMQRLAGGSTLDQAGRAIGTSGDVAHGRVRRALAKLRDLAKGVVP
ncbi:MAG: sigma-70 family RNA polymerase sigma factor [Phycisphaerales bacterium]|jgi:RNA polymerase sigma factor (sigma-70 family)